MGTRNQRFVRVDGTEVLVQNNHATSTYLTETPLETAARSLFRRPGTVAALNGRKKCMSLAFWRSQILSWKGGSVAIYIYPYMYVPRLSTCFPVSA